nr:phage-related tail fiber protein [uncultured Mediterranean phage uvMED]
MANTIRIKRSTGSSAPTTLENAELAFSEGNEIGYVGVGTGGAGGSATTINKAFGKGAFFDKDTVRTTNHVLAGAASGSSAAPTFRALVAADIPSIAHTKISDFDTGVRTNRLDQMTAPTGSVSFNSQNITNVADPVNAQDAATKGFVEATSQGLNVKNSCVAATTGNITISTALNNGDTLDGVTLSTNDRVLVKDQSTASQNGIYVVAASPARAADLAAGANAAGMFTFVEKGTTNADNGFVCTSDSGSAVVGTNNLTFAQFSGAGQITAGDGLDKSGNTLSVDLKANGGLVIESTEIALKLDASSITGTLAIGDGGTGATSASAARTALGLAIGTNVQAYDADLDNLSGCQSGASAALALLTSTEVAILDGATVSTAELNIIDGSTSATSTTLAAADRMVINDAGTMVQVALTDLVTFLENGSVSGFDIDGGTY